MADSYLENALLKLSRQLVAFDEASLMDLWEKYAESVRDFEPTRRWEESVLIFGLIQAVRMKNQLFNYNLSASRQPGAPAPNLEMLDLTAPQSPTAGSPQTASGQGMASPGSKRQPVTENTVSEKTSGGASGKALGKGSVRLSKPKAGKLIPLRRGQD